MSPSFKFFQYVEKKLAKHASHFRVGRRHAFKEVLKLCGMAAGSWEIAVKFKRPQWEIGEMYVERRYQLASVQEWSYGTVTCLAA